jgi:type I restriction enzyme S subunit
MKWEKIKVTSIVDFQGGTQPPKDSWIDEKKEGYIRMLQIRDFTQGKKKFIAYVENKKTLNTCNKEDILIGRYGASIGKILTGLAGAYNVAIVKTIPNKKFIINKYLYFYLNSSYFQNFIQNAGSRAAQAGFNKKELEKSIIPLPPLPIQQQIADLLDTADALRRTTAEQLQQLDDLAESVFLEMFGDVVRNEKGWEIDLLENLIQKIQIGPFGTQLHQSDYIENGIPLINPKHIINLKIVPDYKTTLEKGKYDNLPQYHLKKGDIIMARRGDMGRCAIITEKENNFFCGTGSLFIRPKLKVLDSKFVEKVLSNNSMIKYLELNAKGITMKNLNKTIVKNIPIIVPPIKLQNEFTKIIENIEVQKAELKQSLQDSEDLFKGLLQEIFN